MSHEPVPHSRRQFLGASLAGLGVMSATRLSHGKSPETHSRPRKKLIGWGSDIAYPGKVQNNIRKIEELPLDGIVLSNFSGTQGGKEFTFDWECFGKQKYERKQLADTRAQCSESPTGWLPSSAARASEPDRHIRRRTSCPRILACDRRTASPCSPRRRTSSL